MSELTNQLTQQLHKGLGKQGRWKEQRLNSAVVGPFVLVQTAVSPYSLMQGC